MNETFERLERGKGGERRGFSECYSKREMLDDLERNHGGRKGNFIEKDSNMSNVRFPLVVRHGRVDLDGLFGAGSLMACKHSLGPP